MEIRFLKDAKIILFVSLLLFLGDLLTGAQCAAQTNEGQTVYATMPQADSIAMAANIKAAIDLLGQNPDSALARLTVLEKKYSTYTSGIGMVSAALGKVYGTTGNLKKAELYYKKALLYAQDDSVLKGNIFCGLSLIYQS